MSLRDSPEFRQDNMGIHMMEPAGANGTEVVNPDDSGTGCPLCGFYELVHYTTVFFIQQSAGSFPNQPAACPCEIQCDDQGYQ